MRNVIILMILCCLPLAWGIDTDLGAFEKGETVNIVIPCIYNGSACSISSVCNNSIIYPNGSILVEQASMSTSTGYYHNYTLEDSSTVGRYLFSAYCTDQGYSDKYDAFFIINESGEIENDNKLLIIYLVMISVVIMYFVVAFLLDNVHILPKLVTLFSGFINMIGLIFMVYIETISVSNTGQMLLYIFTANLIIVFALIVYYWLYILKKSVKMAEEREEYV